MLQSQSPDNTITVADQHRCDPNSMLIKHDRMDQHNLLHVNYTAYDVQHSQDVVNASTSHHNIMMLAEPSDSGDSTSDHLFRYARIIGVYHVNTVYVGHGMLDYQPCCMEFLWVRCYENTGVMRNGWQDQQLNHIWFLSISKDGAFRFVDPSDVLRSCHIIPAFARGKLHIDNKGLSLCAQDSEDWIEYYVNR
jgi:hypothetical protein